MIALCQSGTWAVIGNQAASVHVLLSCIGRSPSRRSLRAAKVHAVDVGHGQLAWTLRNDPRLGVHKKTNARHLIPETIRDPIEILICDIFD